MSTATFTALPQIGLPTQTAAHVSTWSYVTPLVVGVYGSDLHKLAINATSMWRDQPLAWQGLASILDVVLAVFIVLACFAEFLKWVLYSYLPRNVFVPAVLQLSIVLTLGVALYRFYDELSLIHFAKYVGGNAVLFFGILFGCKNLRHVQFVCRIWVVAGMLLGYLGLWYWKEGLTWSSARTSLVPGTGIRMGYQCAVAFVYLYLSKDPLLGRLSVPVGLAWVFAVLTSGSKMAFVLLSVTLGAYYQFDVFAANRNVGRQFVINGLVIASGIITLIAISSSGKRGFHEGLLDPYQYEASLEAREEINSYFFTGFSDNPTLLLFGAGISAAYADNTGEYRLHSVTHALLLETGVLGLAIYVLFCLVTLISGTRAIMAAVGQRRRRRLLEALVAISALLICKAEVTSDLPGNRELWMFSALVAVYLSRRSEETALPQVTSAASTTMGKSDAGWATARRLSASLDTGSPDTAAPEQTISETESRGGAVVEQQHRRGRPPAA